MYMTSDEGEFYHKATIADGSVCGIYMYSDPDQRIEVRFNYLDVPCENGGLVAVINIDCLYDNNTSKERTLTNSLLLSKKVVVFESVSRCRVTCF